MMTYAATYFKDNYKRLMAFNFLVEVGQENRARTQIGTYLRTQVRMYNLVHKII